MTTPAMSYYENMIKEDPAMKKEYRRHLWPVGFTARNIRSCTFLYSGDIVEYRKGCLAVRKDPPNPAWEPPEEYLRTVTIPLSLFQEARIRSALRKTPFARLRTDPCAFVNLVGGYSISEHFTCTLGQGRQYHFADRNLREELAPLRKVLRELCEASEEYRQIEEMRKWIFDFDRLDRLNERR